MHLVFDTGPRYGMGHRRRMTALATALERHGVTCSLQATDERAEADRIFVDSYRNRADDASRFSAGWIGAIDDLGRDLAVDLLVDPSSSSDPRRAKDSLQGLRYALLDPSLAERHVREVGEDAKVVLVTAGAADVNANALHIARSLVELDPSLDVRLVAGPWSSDEPPDGVRAIRAPDGIADHLADADVVVTAAGVTLLEALALGRPAVAFVTADNQSRYARLVSDAGAALVTRIGEVTATTVRLLRDAEERRRLAQRGPELVDGRGADRVADAVVSNT